MQSCKLIIFNKIVRIDSQNTFIHEIVLKNYGAFNDNDCLNGTESTFSDLHYELKQGKDKLTYTIVRNKNKIIHCEDLGMFVYCLEKDMTIELEKLCSSLFFLHGAALEKNGEVLLLTGRSGAGKSTTTWGLLNNGFNYLSDELAPVNLELMHVTPYPHAVCLKKPPPLYPLPNDILKTNRTMHVPTALLPGDTHLKAFPLTKIIIVEFSADNLNPELTNLSPASACMNIYSNGLNQLAHENDGLTAASRIAENCECYSLAAASLDDTCELIRALF